MRLAAVEVAGKAVLWVTKVELVHNHEVSKVLNDMLSQNRRLNQQQQDAVQSLVCLPYWRSPLAIFDNAVSFSQQLTYYLEITAVKSYFHSSASTASL